jgi:tetratricopeptide (TPR) repeat protein
VIGRFRTRETLLLLALTTGAIAAGGALTHLAWGWTLGLIVSFLLFAYIPLAVRLQDVLLEQYLARGWYSAALRIAGAVRDSARSGVNRDLAEFEVGLVHLARGANDDAVRSFRRVERHRLKPKTRLVVTTYAALAELRACVGDNSPQATSVIKAVAEALASSPDDPYLLSAKGEALLALGDSDAAFEALKQSLAIDDDPSDPSPGERHTLLARSARALGRMDAAREAYQTAAALRKNAPFVAAARRELEALATDAN